MKRKLRRLLWGALLALILVPAAVRAEETETITKIELSELSYTVHDHMTGWDACGFVSYAFPEGAPCGKGFGNVNIQQDGEYVYEGTLKAGDARLFIEVYAEPLGLEVKDPAYDFDPEHLGEIEVRINGEKRDDVTVDYYNASWRCVDVIIPITVEVFDGKEYAVSFDTAGGTAVEPQKIASGGHAAEPEPPVREGMAFMGWYKDKTFTEPFDFHGDTVTADMTLYACWEPEVKVQTIGRIEIEGLHAAFSDLMTGAEARAAVSYAHPEGAPYGKGNRNVYIMQNGEDIYDARLTAGDALLYVEVYAEPFGENVPNAAYDFDAERLSEIEVLIDGEKRNGVTVTGYNEVWRCVDVVIPVTVEKLVPEPAAFTLSFEMKGHGAAIPPQTAGENGRFSIPEEPSAEGYVFRGWYADEAFKAFFDFGQPAEADRTAYAKWEKQGGTGTERETEAETEEKTEEKTEEDNGETYGDEEPEENPLLLIGAAVLGIAAVAVTTALFLGKTKKKK